MAIDVYLQIEGIKGESQDDKHKDWIEITGVRWGVFQPRSATASTAGGRSAITVEHTDKFAFQEGDIVVIQPTRHGNPAGHIAGYDGTNWVSDFVQRELWPGPVYSKEKPGYVVYRR